MTGVDANIFVALAVGGHPLQPRAVDWVAAELAAGRRLVTTAGVLAEFLHVATDPRRFSPPLLMEEALRWVEAWLAKEETLLLAVEEADVQLSLRWLRQHHLGRKRILDTQLAATLHHQGVRRLITSNPDDFRVFGVFELLVP
jgi:predicted nucleic acid-binding protein